MQESYQPSSEIGKTEEKKKKIPTKEDFEQMYANKDQTGVNILQKELMVSRINKFLEGSDGDISRVAPENLSQLSSLIKDLAKKFDELADVNRKGERTGYVNYFQLREHTANEYIEDYEGLANNLFEGKETVEGLRNYFFQLIGETKREVENGEKTSLHHENGVIDRVLEQADIARQMANTKGEVNLSRELENYIKEVREEWEKQKATFEKTIEEKQASEAKSE